MGKLRVGQLADVAGVLRWDIHIDDRSYYRAGRRRRARDSPRRPYRTASWVRGARGDLRQGYLRAVYALCNSKGVQVALARLSAACRQK